MNNAGIGEVTPGKDADRMNGVAEAQIQEMMAGGPIKTFSEATQNLADADWDRMLRVHLYGTFHCTRAALKVMEPRGYGRIVNISSIAGTVRARGRPALLRRQGRHPRLHALGGARGRRARHHGERDRARLHRDADDRAASRPSCARCGS